MSDQIVGAWPESVAAPGSAAAPMTEEEHATTTPAQPTVVVTGSGSGMGRVTAERFVNEGWQVIGLDIAESRFDHDGPGTLHPLIVDIRSREAIEAALAGVLTAGDRIDAVANIAGVYPPSTLADYTEAAYHRIFDINVLGTINVIAASRPYFGDGSTVVNFSSVDAYTVSVGQLLYGASKAAVSMLTKSLALELAADGVRVNCIAPGWVATPGNAATGRMEAASRSIPLGRVADPQEIADWVYLLSSKRYTSFLTGETIVIAGGDVLR